MEENCFVTWKPDSTESWNTVPSPKHAVIDVFKERGYLWLL